MKKALFAIILCALALCAASCKNGQTGDDNASYASQLFWRGRARRTAGGFETGKKEDRVQVSPSSYASVQAAVDAASLIGGGDVVISTPTEYGDTLFVRNGVSIVIGDEATLRCPCICADGTDGFSLTGFGELAGTICASGAKNILLEGVLVSSGDRPAVSLSGCDTVNILNLMIRSSLPEPFVLEGCTNTRVVRR